MPSVCAPRSIPIVVDSPIVIMAQACRHHQGKEYQRVARTETRLQRPDG